MGVGMRRCVVCGTLVEGAVPAGHSGLDFIADRRMPAGLLILTPPLCWYHRGLVIPSAP